MPERTHKSELFQLLAMAADECPNVLRPIKISYADRRDFIDGLNYGYAVLNRYALEADGKHGFGQNILHEQTIPVSYQKPGPKLNILHEQTIPVSYQKPGPKLNKEEADGKHGFGQNILHEQTIPVSYQKPGPKLNKDPNLEV
ncbi:hypothetical protein QE152_g9608 [Popillia japonica]|uniref:Uncharacterized protein n=1 Tax=Popillia japonica TaxID=7064 RepID=A0AAW1LZZ9_POPJA